MLRYFDNMRKMSRLTVVMVERGPTPDPALLAQVKTLKSDSMEQIAVLQRLAAAVKQQGRPS